MWTLHIQQIQNSNLFITILWALLRHTHQDTKRHRQRHSRTESPEQYVLQSWGRAEALQKCVSHVTPPCVSNSHFHFWATGKYSWWTGWSWQPCTSPLAILLLRPSPASDLGVEYYIGLGWGRPGPRGARVCPGGGWRPWRRGSEWVGTFLSLPVRRRRPGASSPVWTAPRWFWECRGSPRRPRGWGTSPDSGGEREEEKAMWERGKDGWIWGPMKRDRWQKWQVPEKSLFWVLRI